MQIDCKCSQWSLSPQKGLPVVSSFSNRLRLSKTAWVSKTKSRMIHCKRVEGSLSCLHLISLNGAPIIPFHLKAEWSLCVQSGRQALCWKVAQGQSYAKVVSHFVHHQLQHLICLLVCLLFFILILSRLSPFANRTFTNDHTANKHTNISISITSTHYTFKRIFRGKELYAHFVDCFLSIVSISAGTPTVSSDVPPVNRQDCVSFEWSVNGHLCSNLFLFIASFRWSSSSDVTVVCCTRQSGGVGGKKDFDWNANHRELFWFLRWQLTSFSTGSINVPKEMRPFWCPFVMSLNLKSRFRFFLTHFSFYYSSGQPSTRPFSKSSLRKDSQRGLGHTAGRSLWQL